MKISAVKLLIEITKDVNHIHCLAITGYNFYVI